MNTITAAKIRAEHGVRQTLTIRVYELADEQHPSWAYSVGTTKETAPLMRSTLRVRDLAGVLGELRQVFGVIVKRNGGSSYARDDDRFDVAVILRPGMGGELAWLQR